ncbi:hypothetical protein [Nocardia tengchongensis]|uniref:hypothetical protein n=1 Tax=Nocardia tengchongensis TaxID=2055889 RepID=UPI00367ED10B
MAAVAVEALSAGDTINFGGEPALIQSLLRRDTQKSDRTYDLKLKVLSSGVTAGRSYRAGTEVELIPVEIKPVTLASTIERICTFVDPDGSLYELGVDDFQPAQNTLCPNPPDARPNIRTCRIPRCQNGPSQVSRRSTG